MTLWSSGTYKYDGSGNVVKTGNGYYLYDRVSRLIEGRIQDGPTGGGTQKWQTYAYGPFGNIQSISGTSGRSTPTSSSTNRLTGAGTFYDSAGNLINWNANVYEYDRAERLTQVTGSGGTLLKAFTYGNSNAAGVRTNGRLETATRYNSVGSPFNATVAVTEGYVYGGRQGRASSRTTQMFFNGTPSEMFSQSWTWNALGDLGSLTYPQCVFAGCAPLPRTISPGYTNGFLTSVPGWASSISHHPNGMLNQVSHSNSIVDSSSKAGRPSDEAAAGRRPAASSLRVGQSSGPIHLPGIRRDGCMRASRYGIPPLGDASG